MLVFSVFKEGSWVALISKVDKGGVVKVGLVASHEDELELDNDLDNFTKQFADGVPIVLVQPHVDEVGSLSHCIEKAR